MTYDVIESSYHHYHGVALDSDGVERRDAECFAALEDGNTFRVVVPREIKREWFAAIICAGIVANSEGSGSFANFARDAVMQADALIAALNECVC